jgi:hypothetical protein
VTAFVKTLFGDAATLGVIAFVMAAEILLVWAGLTNWAVIVIPCLVLTGAAWLAAR